MSKAAELAALIGSQTALSNRNLIINGAMQVAQRGTSDTIDGGGWDYVIDRFCALGQSSAGVFTYSQDSDAPVGFQKSLKVAVTTSDTSLAVGDIYCIRHTIEGYNSAHLDFGTSNAKTITLSFWVKSSLTGTFGGALNSEGNNRSYAFTYNISSANTWEYKTITISGDTIGTWGVTNSHGVRITWGLGVGTTYSGTAGSWAGSEYFSATGATSVIGTASATWYITGVSLEVGEQATPFEHRSFGDELVRCQRYYEKSHEYGTAPTHGFTGGNFEIWQSRATSGTSAVYYTIQYKVRKRASASVTTFNNTASGAGYYHISGNADYTNGSINGGDRKFSIRMPSTGNQNEYLFSWISDAEL